MSWDFGDLESLFLPDPRREFKSANRFKKGYLKKSILNISITRE